MDKENKLFKKYIIISFVLHLLLIIAYFFGMPSLFQELPKHQESLTFEMVSIKDITNIKSQDITQKKKVEQKKAKRIEKSLKSSPPKQDKSPPVKQVVQKNKPPKKDAINLKNNKKPLKQKISDKKIIKTAQKNKVKKKNTAKPQQDSMDSIFKNLEESVGDNDSSRIYKNNHSTKNNNKFFKSDNYNRHAPISITEKNLIKGAIEKNWNKPNSLPMNNQIKVVFEIEFDKKGKIVRSKKLKTTCNYSDSVCQIAIESVKRAIGQTKIVKNLPPKRYELWKIVELRFDLDLL
ncbi:MAG: hypothetical protein DGJ47_000022 [Rickettsiaceae bacterium]